MTPFRFPIRPVLLGLALLGLATPAWAQSLSIQDLPGLFAEAEARAVQPGGAPPAGEHVLRIPIAGSYDRKAGALVLSAAESPYRAVRLSELGLQTDPWMILARLNDYEIRTTRAVDRPRTRARAEIAACRGRATSPAQRDSCEAAQVVLTLSLTNGTDIALPRRAPLAADRARAALAGGLFLEIALRLDPTVAGTDAAARMDMRARLTGLTVVYGAGEVLVRGVTSDAVTFDGPPPAYRWVSRPGAEQINRYYPDRAMRQDVPGRAVLQCKVGHFGWLRACGVVSETPVDYGFGQAGVRIARGFRMAPAQAGDDLTGRLVNVPIVFVMAGAPYTPPPAPPSTP
jgi:TonB family protein